LRERRQEIKIFAERCLAQSLARQGIAAEKSEYRFTQEAWECLLNHDWPGNFPELASVAARAVALAGGKEIGKEALAWLPHKTHRRSADSISVPLVGNLKESIHAVIEAVIERCRGNKAAAARALGLHRRTLYRILRGEAGHEQPGESREDRR
jgi:DNA-binding NtrC family response regulator